MPTLLGYSSISWFLGLWKKQLYLEKLKHVEFDIITRERRIKLSKIDVIDPFKYQRRCLTLREIEKKRKKNDIS